MVAISGVSYHRLARTAQHRWWDPLLGTVMLATWYGLAVLLLHTVVMAAGARSVSAVGPVGETGLVLLSVAVALPLVLVAARVTQYRRPGTVSSVAGRLRWRWLGVCLLVAVVVMATATGLNRVAGSATDGGDARWLGWTAAVATGVMLVALVPWQAAAEEYLFRGWLLQAVGAYLRGPWLPIGIQAALFAAAHGWGTVPGFASLLLFGAVTGWLVVRTGGLEAAIALHTVTNLATLLPLAAAGDLAARQTLAHASWPTATVNAVAVCLCAAVVAVLARRYGLRATTRGPEPWPAATRVRGG